MALKGNVVKDYLGKFPDTPSKTLAGKIYNENKSLFTNVENVRRHVRYYRGSSGDLNREDLADRTYVNPPGKLNPFDDLPEGLTYFDEWEPYYIQGKKILVISDLHAPYHHKEALKIALMRGKEIEVDTILINGDFVDFYSVSFWQKDPRKRNFKKELDIVYDILDLMRDQFPDAEIIYKVGNHEERYERYMKVKAPELLDVEDFELAKILHADKYSLKIVSDKRIVKVGKYLNIIHGHEFGRSFASPVNPARGLFLKGHEIALGAHYHQTSQHTAKSMTGEIIACWSLGCLCDLRPEYLPINNWNFGFAEIRRDGNKFHLDNRRIIDGKIY